MDSIFTEDPDFETLVVRTRAFLRSIGLAEFDQSFSSAELDIESEDFDIEESRNDLRDPNQFREYLEAATAYLRPVTFATAQQLVDDLNGYLSEPISTLELEVQEQRLDLLSAETYAALDLARGTVLNILESMGWGPNPDLSSDDGSLRSTPRRRGQ